MNDIQLSEASKAVVASLAADVFGSANLMQVDQSSQFYRRTLVRTFFGFIEGFGNALRDGLLDLPDSARLNPCQIGILKDERYEIEKNGKPKAIEARYPSLNLLAATLRYWAELKGHDETQISTKIFGNDGWRKFQQTLEVRHRLTHPKISEGIDVSDTEIRVSLDAFVWLLTVLTDLLDIKIDKAGLDRFLTSQRTQ
jgi:hypothetical protein